MGNKRILIVDDHYGVRNLLCLALAKYEVNEAKNGNQAVTIAQEWIPDLVIIDLKMPGPSGMETITTINKLSPHTRFLLITASNNQAPPFKNEAISGLITKPFDLEHLTTVVEDILQEKPGA